MNDFIDKLKAFCQENPKNAIVVLLVTISIIIGGGVGVNVAQDNDSNAPKTETKVTVSQDKKTDTAVVKVDDKKTAEKQALNGLVKIDGKSYYYQNGQPQWGVFKIGDKYYFFDKDTKQLANKRNYVQSQWGDWYLISDQGQVLSGKQDWAGSTWYFDPSTYLVSKDKFVQLDGKMYYFDKNGQMFRGVYSNWGHDYYFKNDGTRATNEDVTINGVKYHADKDGILTPKDGYTFTEDKINYTYALGENEGDSRIAQNYYIILHEVGAESGAAANARYLKNNWQTANTTFVVGDNGQVFCVSEPGYVSWGALDANPYAPIQIELGRTWNRDQFIKDYTTYVTVARYYAQKYGIPFDLDQGGEFTKGIKSHKWVSDNISGDHQDPYGYLSSWGISKNQLAQDLKNGVNQQQLQKIVYQARK